MPEKPPTNDVTGDFPQGALPVPPISTFTSANDVMRGAEDTSYLGRLTEAEAKQLVTRSVTLTRWTDMLIDLLAQDSRFGYESKAEVMRHAIEMLVDYYRDNKAFLAEHQGFASDVIRRQHDMRNDAERARIRTEFRENITRFDDEIDTSRQIGDYEHVAHRLSSYREMLRTCESETQRRLLREVLAGSIATRSAVIAFYKWTHETYRAPVDHWDAAWPELAEAWARFYEENA